MAETAAMRLPPPRLLPEVLASLATALGEGRVSVSEADRLSYAHDMWPLSLIQWRHGQVPYPPDAVCWPGGTTEVVEVLRLANREGFAVIPYGAGSGVCGGTLPVKGGVVLDLKRMDRILRIDEASHTLEVEAGAIGQLVEQELDRKGFTLGHFPSSIYCSTIGGYLAARSAGQLSTRYGKIEDMVLALSVVTPTGELLETRAAPRSATGPDWKQLFIGSEGTLGVITKAVLRLHPRPEGRIFRAWSFRDVQSGLRAIRETLQRGARPAAVRLYDELDTLLVGSGTGTGTGTEGGEFPAPSEILSLRAFGDRLKALFPMEMGLRVALQRPDLLNALAKLAPARCQLVMTFEGPWEVIPGEEKVAAKAAERAGGIDLGEGPAKRWWKTRYHVSYKQSKIYAEGAAVDTMEVAATWDRLEALYARMREAMSPHALILAHFSHAYPEGCNIYFTFIFADRGAEETAALYRRIWDAGLEACLAAGGTVSHHHGIGLSKARWLEKELGPLMGLYRGVKRLLDPRDILNPGKLGL